MIQNVKYWLVSFIIALLLFFFNRERSREAQKNKISRELVIIDNF
jgi:hypothetical protein